jgi:hypothetical protein
VYDPHIDGRTLTFGVSGKLYKSNLLMFDRQTDSLWSQLLQQAITGPLTGKKLVMVPSEHTTWELWRGQHPDTVVLSPETGFKRDYGLNPYEQYREGGAPMFSSGKSNSRPSGKLKPMERVLGLELNNVKKAYPFPVLKKMGSDFEDRLGSTAVVVHFDKKSESGFVTDKAGNVVPSVVLFWFAWTGFYPNTLIFVPNKQ